MRKAAGIILLTLGVLFVCGLIDILVIINIIHSSPLMVFIPRPSFVFLLGLVVAAAFLITGGIFCLMRKYWRVCLASASFAVLFVVFNIVYFSAWSPFYWEWSEWPWSDYIYMGWPIWVMLVAAVISVIFVLRTKREWQETSDLVDGNDVSDGD
jgi:hypothetical protein